MRWKMYTGATHKRYDVISCDVGLGKGSLDEEIQLCHKKCIPPKYHEAELTKGEAICLDRCVAKFMEVHDRIGKKLMTSMQDEGAMKQMAGAQR